MIVCGCCLPWGKLVLESRRGGAVRPWGRACRLLPLLQQTAVAQDSQGLCSHKGQSTQSREQHLCLHGLRPCTAFMSARWWYCSWLSMVDDFLLAIAGEVHCRLYGVWCSRVNVRDVEHHIHTYCIHSLAINQNQEFPKHIHSTILYIVQPQAAWCAAPDATQLQL